MELSGSYFGLAVDGGRRGEYDLVDIVLLHDVQEIESALLNRLLVSIGGGLKVPI